AWRLALLPHRPAVPRYAGPPAGEFPARRDARRPSGERQQRRALAEGAGRPVEPRGIRVPAADRAGQPGRGAGAVAALCAQFQKIPRMAQRAGARERTLGDEVLQVACRGRARGLGEADVVLGTQAPGEAIEAFAKQARHDLVLALVQRGAEFLVEPRLA